MPQPSSTSEYYQHQSKYGKLVEVVSTHVRRQIFRSLMEAAQPTPATTVLDVGVTSDTRGDSNFFEAHYPYPERVTALGLEDGSALEVRFPGLKYVQGDALSLPFPDNSFDLAVSWAVIEHIGSRERQLLFLQELSRVSKAFFVTTPNRWYPLEFHTVLPVVHWLPPSAFRRLLRLLNMPFYASEDRLNLLGEREFLSLLPADATCKKLHARLFGLVSNLCVYVERS